MQSRQTLSNQQGASGSAAEQFNKVVSRLDELVSRVINVENNIPIDESDYTEIVHSTTIPLAPFDAKRFSAVPISRRIAYNTIVKLFWILMVVTPPLVFVVTANAKNGPCTYVALEPKAELKLYNYDSKTYLKAFVERQDEFDRRNWCAMQIQINYLYKWYLDLSLIGNSFQSTLSKQEDTCGYILEEVSTWGFAKGNDLGAIHMLKSTGMFAGATFEMSKEKEDGSIYACTILPITNEILGVDSSLIADTFVLLTVILTLFHFAYGPATGRTSSFVFCMLALDKLSGFSYSLTAYYMTLLFTWAFKSFIWSRHNRERHSRLPEEKETLNRL